MARRNNELFIGVEHLNKEGRNIKHPSLFKVYATVNVNKVNDEPIKLIGLDIETNYKTADLKLLGFWNGINYAYYTENFLSVMYSMLKYCDRKNLAMAYWNKLDPFIIFKQFLLVLNKEQQDRALKRYGKVGGVWDRKDGGWKVSPLVEIQLRGSQYRFGIKNVIRSSIQFYIYRNGSRFLNTIWAYDIAQLFKFGLEKEMTSRKDLFPYYSKVDKSAHLVDWDRFDWDGDYKHNIVLKSNEYDARAVYDLGIYIQAQFKVAFGHYAKTLISTGSLARASLIATLKNKYSIMYPDEDEAIKRHVLKDVKSIGFINYYDKWFRMLGGDKLKDLYCLLTESYSGGYIEAINYGYAKEGYYSDIASAYPSIIKGLYDLRKCKITYGKGTPPDIQYSYCFIRGDLIIPLGVNFHPVTVKHMVNLDTNIRAVGYYKASYTLNERKFLESVGATFDNEAWYNIETEGKISPMGEVVKSFIDLRTRFIKEGNSAEYMAKITVNSMYGILFEAVDTYEENDKFEVFRAGYRVGEFFNPLYASIITSETRILMAKASQSIEQKGGKPILIMTDAVFWTGTKDMIPKEFVRDIKTIGYFETPKYINDIVCLGSGRYSYKDPKKGIIISKKRGLNAVALHDPDGIVVDNFNWLKVLKIVEQQRSRIIKIKVRVLISVGMIAHSKIWTLQDLGRIVELDRKVDIITGLTKRFLDDDLKDITVLCDSLVSTHSIYLSKGMLGDGKLNDQTLPYLRAEIMKMVVTTAKKKDLKNRVKAQIKYAKATSDKINKDYNKKYKRLKKYGYTAKERRKMAKWGNDTILDKLREDGKLK